MIDLKRSIINLKFDPFEKLSGFNLSRNLVDTEFAHRISAVMLNWSRLELLLFTIVLAIDRKQSAKWTRLFFKTNAIEARLKAAEAAILDEIQAKRPAFVQHLAGGFARFASIKARRNNLVHGVWSRGKTEDTFIVHPLRLESKQSDLLSDGQIVDLPYLSVLLDDMQYLENLLASLTSEMGAYQMLRKWNKA